MGAIGPAGVPGQEGAPGDTGYDGRNFQNNKFTNSLFMNILYICVFLYNNFGVYEMCTKNSIGFTF